MDIQSRKYTVNGLSYYLKQPYNHNNHSLCLLCWTEAVWSSWRHRVCRFPPLTKQATQHVIKKKESIRLMWDVLNRNRSLVSREPNRMNFARGKQNTRWPQLRVFFFFLSPICPESTSKMTNSARKKRFAVMAFTFWNNITEANGNLSLSNELLFHS